MTKVKRLSACGLHPHREEGVNAHRVEGEDGPRGSVTGLQSCGSVWSCPVCSAHIRAERAGEIATAAKRHLDAGGGLLFAVVTLRHHRGEDLDGLLGGLQDAWRATVNGSPWKRTVERYGVVGTVVVREVTWGAVNGWHPHANVLIFLERPLGVGELDQLDAWLSDRWRRMVLRRGLQEPTLERGVVLQVVRDGEGVGVYAAKVQERDSVALEMTWVEAKRSRTGLLPFELLDAAVNGEAEALRLWWEYEAATSGRRCVTWGKGLRERLGLGEERDDEDIVSDDQTSEDTLLHRFSPREWRMICDAGLEGDVLEALEHPDGREAAKADLLEVLERARWLTSDGRDRDVWRWRSWR